MAQNQGNMSPERTMLVGAAMEGLLAANGYGQSYSADPEGAAKFYASQAVKLADAAMEIMDPKIPIVPPVKPTPVVPIIPPEKK